MAKGTSQREKEPACRERETGCWKLLQPILEEVPKRVDRRLVKTMLELVLGIWMHRNRSTGWLLSELGAQLRGGARRPAGVKRIASLLHWRKWRSGVLVQSLWKQAQPSVPERLNNRDSAYVIWDESVLEKSASLKAEGLCAVRSTNAARLPGYCNPPTERPIFVPGFHGLQILVTSWKGTAVLAH